MVFSGPSTLTDAALGCSAGHLTDGYCLAAIEAHGIVIAEKSPTCIAGAGPSSLLNRWKPVRLPEVVAKRIVLVVKVLDVHFYHRRSGETGTDQCADQDLLTRRAGGQFAVREPSKVRLLQQLRRPAGLPN